METFKNVKEMEVFEVEGTANMFWIKTYKTKKLMNKYSINLKDYIWVICSNDIEYD